MCFKEDKNVNRISGVSRPRFEKQLPFQTFSASRDLTFVTQPDTYPEPPHSPHPAEQQISPLRIPSQVWAAVS